MDAQADEAAVSGKRPADEAVPELAQLVVQLDNFVNMEREQRQALCGSALDALLPRSLDEVLAEEAKQRRDEGERLRKRD